MKLKFWMTVGVVMFGLGTARAELKVGDEAPDFTAPASNDQTFNLKASLASAPIVLYFYPKDNTPGCTKEACGIRDSFGAFRNLKATVYGISYDSIASHKKFIEKHQLPFVLLSDSDHAIAKKYNANGFIFAKRMTYIVDKAGKIAFIDPSVSPSKHSQELQDALQKLQ
jgi:peroxiredoxin Q/BCP